MLEKDPRKRPSLSQLANEKIVKKLLETGFVRMVSFTVDSFISDR